MPDPSLFVATPAYGGMLTEPFVQGLLGLQFWALQRRVPFQFFTLKHASIIQLARNLLVREFLKTAHTHLLFIDADIGFDAREVGRMFDYRDLGIVGALYPRKSINWRAVGDVMRQHPAYPPEKLAEVSGNFDHMLSLPDAATSVSFSDSPFPASMVPGGLMLIPRGVFEAIAAMPETRQFQVNGDGPIIEFFETGISSDGRFYGEDDGFCAKAIRAGIEVHACAWLRIIHTGSFDFVGNLQAIADNRAGPLGR